MGGIPKTTTYIGPVEITPEGDFWLYPLPNIKLAGGEVEAMHTDQLGSVRVITDETGVVDTQRTYLPFGKIHPATPSATDPETHGFIPLSGISMPCRGGGRTLRRRLKPAIPQRKILRPGPRHFHPAGLV